MCITKTVCCWHCNKFFRKKEQPNVYENCPNCGKGYSDLSDGQRVVVNAELKPLYPLMFLARHKCLNTMQICRAMNNFPLKPAKGHKWKTGENPCFCKEQQNGQVTQRIKCNKMGCNPQYLNVFNILYELEKLGLVKSEKRKYYDSGKKISDTFRFWFIDREGLRSTIMKNTLESYGITRQKQ